MIVALPGLFSYLFFEDICCTIFGRINPNILCTMPEGVGFFCEHLFSKYGIASSVNSLSE